MKTLITLDHELFFGRRTGSIEKCLVEPFNALRPSIESRGGKACLFLDAGFVLRLRSEAASSDMLRREYDTLCRHLDGVTKSGHELQLHVHPHWEDCRWEDGQWKMRLDRYRLHDFSASDINQIVADYTNLIAEFVPHETIRAYRAGGWVLQPFRKISDALWNNGIRIDSTVFHNGVSESKTHVFDFSGAPSLSKWRFDSDPLVEVPQGRFLEIPIASHLVWPGFFWKLAMSRKLKVAADKSFGDGSAISLSPKDMLRKLLWPSVSVVSIDGRKTSFLQAAFDEWKRAGREDFVIIGHPKALTRRSIADLDLFLERNLDDIDIVGYGGYE